MSTVHVHLPVEEEYLPILDEMLSMAKESGSANEDLATQISQTIRQLRPTPSERLTPGTRVRIHGDGYYRYQKEHTTIGTVIGPSRNPSALRLTNYDMFLVENEWGNRTDMGANLLEPIEE